jgi:hypothetical protein
MSHAVTITVGVVLAKERIDHPWQDHRWRVASILIDPPPLDGWRILEEGPATTLYHAANLPLELHRTETAAYVVNLESNEPSIYVTVRQDPEDDAEDPVRVHLVSASPFEGQGYEESGVETTDRVPMPEALLPLLSAFVAEHHVDKPFIKRQRSRTSRAEEDEKFGQEPIFERIKRGAKPRDNGHQS